MQSESQEELKYEQEVDVEVEDIDLENDQPQVEEYSDENMSKLSMTDFKSDGHAASTFQTEYFDNNLENLQYKIGNKLRASMH